MWSLRTRMTTIRTFLDLNLKLFLGIVNYTTVRHVSIQPLHYIYTLASLYQGKWKHVFCYRQISWYTLPGWIETSQHYVLACDASPYIQVLSHCIHADRPIAFASRTRGSVKKRYSHLDKEASAIILLFNSLPFTVEN